MLYIRIELWRFGDPRKRVLLGEGMIANIGGTDTKGDYEFSLAGDTLTEGTEPELTFLLKGKNGKIKLREGQVKGFPRQKLLAWDLLYRVLNVAFGERNRGS